LSIRNQGDFCQIREVDGVPQNCEGTEIDTESGAIVAEGSLGDDFGPLPGEFVGLLEVLIHEPADGVPSSNVR
jgi:hypothetical protein